MMPQFKPIFHQTLLGCVRAPNIMGFALGHFKIIFTDKNIIHVFLKESYNNQNSPYYKCLSYGTHYLL